LTALAVASSGLGLSSASFAESSSVIESMSVDAGFPSQTEMLALIGEGRDSSYEWNVRAKGLVMVLWPAMDIVARETGKPLSVELFNQISSLDGMEAFSKRHPCSRDAANVDTYRENLPGFGREENRKMMDSNHSYLTMQLHHALSTWTAFEAEDIVS
jgi:hypothetical protein